MAQQTFKVSLRTRPRAAPQPKAAHPAIQHSVAPVAPTTPATPVAPTTPGMPAAPVAPATFATPRLSAPPVEPSYPDVAPRNAAPFAVVYGILGFVVAALILVVGFWPTLLLTLFVTVGVLIGRYRDGDRYLRQLIRHFIDRIN